MLSKKRKKTAVPSIVSTRTARSGCVACTFAVSSCTQTLREIRCAIRRNTPTKASRPELDTVTDEYDGGFLPFEMASARNVSTRTINSALGSADRQIEASSTIPTSSASPSCASLAAASSSLATAQLMANVRSPPRADSASVAPPDPISADDMYYGDTQALEHEMSRDEIAEASTEGFTLCRNGQHGPMRLRRLIFSRNVPHSELASRKAITKRKKVPASARSRYPICFASIFGATLKTILDFSGVATDKKAETSAALHEMLQFLSPVCDAIGAVGGADQPHLVNGLATHRVSSKQRKFLAECGPADKSTWLHRSGLKDVTMGVTAAVLVAHYVMAATGCDAGEVTANLARCVNLARELLDTWNVSRFAALSMHKAALGAEIRALERARSAAKAAEQVAASTGLDRMTALQLQLSYMRSAAWPGGVVCSGGGGHLRVLAQLERGESIEQKGVDAPCSMPCMPVLQLLRGIGRDDGVANSSGSELSSLASSSAASSVGSEDLTVEALDPCEEIELVKAVERMRTVAAAVA